MSKETENEQIILFFDGVCGLCNSFVDFVITADSKRKILFSPLQGQTAKEKLPEEFHKELNTFILWKNGEILQKSSAALAVFSLLGGFWMLMTPFKLLPKAFRDAIYDFIAKNRYKWFGKKESCRLPTPEERQLFLD